MTVSSFDVVNSGIYECAVTLAVHEHVHLLMYGSVFA